MTEDHTPPRDGFVQQEPKRDTVEISITTARLALDVVGEQILTANNAGDVLKARAELTNAIADSIERTGYGVMVAKLMRQRLELDETTLIRLGLIRSGVATETPAPHSANEIPA